MSDREFARLHWRCRRGVLELDLLLQTFLERGYHQLEKLERDQFAALLELPDPRLLTYLLGTESPPHQGWSNVIEKIRRTIVP